MTWLDIAVERCAQNWLPELVVFLTPAHHVIPNSSAETSTESVRVLQRTERPVAGAWVHCWQNAICKDDYDTASALQPSRDDTLGEYVRAPPARLFVWPQGTPTCILWNALANTILAHAGESHPRYTLKAPPSFTLTPESFSSGNPFTALRWFSH